MYCLEKLQRELAYFFDMDLSALPRVQDLLAAQGYTQVQKGDEIIKLEPSAQAESTLESTTQISQEIKDIIDSSPAKGRDIQIIGEANFTPQVVEYAHKNSKKVAKNAVDSQKANPSPAPYGYEPHADANTPPLKTDTDIIPQSTATLTPQAQEYSHKILQGLRKTAQTPLNKLADEVPSTDRKFMIREAKYIKQQAKEFADNFANLRWQDLRSAIRYAKVPYDEAMFKELKESIESREFARFIESSYPRKPTQKSLFDTQAPAETPAQKVDSSVESTPPKDTLESTPRNPTLESTSTPTPSQPPQAQRLKEALQIPLTDDRGLQSLAFGRVGSDAEIMEQVLIPQARNAYRKGTSQNKLEVAARNALKKHRQDLEQSLNITPIKEFGTNYAEHYRDGKGAIEKLLLEKQGQVSGAFYRKELGDIDLVWGEVQGKGKEAKGWGLAKIIEKHLNAGDFKAFGEGEAGLINAMSEIIQNGKVVTQNGVDSIVLRKNGEEYRVGISKGWDNVGENKWIITSYKNNKYKESAETSYHDTFTSKEPLENLATDIIPQPTQKSLFDTQESTPPNGF